jgi:hypothetical protein
MASRTAFRRAQVAVLALVVGYFFLPYGVRAWIPPWLPFLSALALEAHFFLGGYLQARRGLGTPPKPDRGPQPRDLEDLGGSPWPDEDAEEDVEDEPEPEELDELEPDEPERRAGRGRSLLEAAAVLAVVAGILFVASRPHGWDAVSSADRARAEARFSSEATRIAGHPVRIGCDTSGTHVGFVQESDGVAVVGGDRAYITPAICDTLYQLAFKGRVQSSARTGRALAVLAHEAWHLRGTRDEGLANCYGFQSGVQIGVALGLSESRARAMMREQLASNASDAAANPQYLVPTGCRDGGANDLHPNVDAFP